jgi:hypothetical protein
MDLRDALIDWDEPDERGSNTAHIAEHGLTPEEVERALFDDNTTFDVSDSSGRPSLSVAPVRVDSSRWCSRCLIRPIR